jgi:hypothetical protein
LHPLVSRSHTSGPGKIEYLTDQVGASHGFAQQRFFHLFAMGQLSTRADGRKRGPYQKPARTQLGLWHFVPGYFPGANILQNSSHDDSLLSHQDEEQRKMQPLRAVS